MNDYKTYRYKGNMEASLHLPCGHVFLDRGQLFTARSHAEEAALEGEFGALFVLFQGASKMVDPGPKPKAARRTERKARTLQPSQKDLTTGPGETKYVPVIVAEADKPAED